MEALGYPNASFDAVHKQREALLLARIAFPFGPILAKVSLWGSLWDSSAFAR